MKITTKLSKTEEKLMQLARESNRRQVSIMTSRYGGDRDLAAARKLEQKGLFTFVHFGSEREVKRGRHTVYSHTTFRLTNPEEAK